MKALFLSLGIVLVALGVIGIFVPLLPTTPFLLLALACFTRSSKRLHAWLLEHRILGKYLNDWENHRVIPLKGKILATVMIGTSLLYIGLSNRFDNIVLGVVLLSLAAVLVYIWRFPSSIHQRDAVEDPPAA